MPCSPQQRRDLFEDKISSRQATRPGLAQALDYLRRGDVLMIWKLDRLGRSVKEALTIADELHDRGVTLRILTGTLARDIHPSGEGKFFFTSAADRVPEPAAGRTAVPLTASPAPPWSARRHRRGLLAGTAVVCSPAPPWSARRIRRPRRVQDR